MMVYFVFLPRTSKISCGEKMEFRDVSTLLKGILQELVFILKSFYHRFFSLFLFQTSLIYFSSVLRTK